MPLNVGQHGFTRLYQGLFGFAFGEPQKTALQVARGLGARAARKGGATGAVAAVLIAMTGKVEHINS